MSKGEGARNLLFAIENIGPRRSDPPGAAMIVLQQNTKSGILRMTKTIDHEESSGNVFADLGVPQPEEAQLKADLAIRVTQLIEERGLTQQEAAAVLGITQPYVSKLMRGQLRGFSVERLLRFLVSLGQEIDVVIRPKAESTQRSHVRMVLSGPSV